MSLRDQFAKEAMNGLLSSGDINLEEAAINDNMTPVWDDIAEYSYQLADAMLKEREKKQGEQK